jgi:H+-transporting ATPase
LQNELTQKMEQHVVVVRDGKAQQILTRLLMPGDVLLLKGGDMVAADVDWLEGDTLSIDTSALTGESLPRKYPSDEHGIRILSGMTILSGEAYAIVRKIGAHTEIGQSQESAILDKSRHRVSVFEQKILFIVKGIIVISVFDVIVILVLRGTLWGEFTASRIRELLLTVLSILVASVPLALPLVLQVTMALGASAMASKYNAVVTSLPALQDISAMTTLCSDKTGTLTTARISILSEQVYLNPPYTLSDLVLYTRLASNPDKEDDPIDRACLQWYEQYAHVDTRAAIPDFHQVRSVGFNSTYKRTFFVYSHPRLGEVKVAKGLPNKVVDTSDGG